MTTSAPDDLIERLTEPTAAELLRLAGTPEFSTEVGRIIERSLESESDPTVLYDDVVDRLTRRLGDHAVAHWALVLIGFTSAEEPYDDAYELLSEDDAAQLDELLNLLHSLYGPEIRTAIHYAKEDPENWARIKHRVSWLPVEQGFRIELHLTTFGLKEFELAGPPVSFLRLVNYILGILTPMEGDTEELFLEALNDYALTAAEFEAKFLGPAEEPLEDS